MIKQLAVIAIAAASTCLAITTVRAEERKAEDTCAASNANMIRLMEYQGYRYHPESNTWSTDDNIYNARAMTRTAENLRDWRLSCPSGN
jgi:hypothetical protein